MFTFQHVNRQYRVSVKLAISQLKVDEYVSPIRRNPRRILSVVVRICAAKVCRRKSIGLMMNVLIKKNISIIIALKYSRSVSTSFIQAVIDRKWNEQSEFSDNAKLRKTATTPSLHAKLGIIISIALLSINKLVQYANFFEIIPHL